MKKIVVVGGGYAGLKSVVLLQKKLKEKVEIVLVDHNSYHYETTRLPEIIAGEKSYTKISYPFADVLNDKMTKFIQDEVTLIDYENKKVKLANHDDLSYDYLILGLGFVLGTFGIEGAEEYGMSMHSVDTALAIRDHIYAQMKHYRDTKDPKALNIVMCGGGFQAIEISTAIAENRPRFAKMAGGIDPNEIKVYAFDGSPRLLPMFDDNQTKYALELIKNIGVEIINPAKIQKLTADAIYYKMNDDDENAEARKIEANTKIWMMGFSGSPVIAKSGFDQRRGRIMVDDHLTVPGHEEIYSLGDVSSVMVPGKKWPWPNTAQLALSMADYAAEDLTARIKGKNRPAKYTYKDLGVVVAVGDNHAAAYALGHNYRGRLASIMKKMIVDKSLMETGGIKETMAVGRFDLYH